MSNSPTQPDKAAPDAAELKRFRAMLNANTAPYFDKEARFRPAYNHYLICLNDPHETPVEEFNFKTKEGADIAIAEISALCPTTKQ